MPVMPQMKILVTAEQIQTRVKELGAQIRKDHGNETVVLLGVLKGAYPFLADLSREISGDVMVDFVQISSYGADKSSSGVVQIKKDHDINIEGRHVIIVEDIVDTGLTLKYLLDLLATRKPASLKVAAAVSKPDAHQHKIDVDYLGFDIPPEFVVGYGLDHAERYRQLPYIAVLQGDET